MEILTGTLDSGTTHASSLDFTFFSSPWSNAYDPPLEDGAVPSAKLRKLEITANDAFDTYRDMLVMPKFVFIHSMYCRW